MSHFRRTRVAVIRGGPSSQYEFSLRTGKEVLSALSRMPEKYHAEDIYIDKEGRWHKGGIARKEADILKVCDVVFNALHGDYAEDGGVAKLCRMFGIPHTGSSLWGHSMSHGKDISHAIAGQGGIKVPRGIVLTPESVDENNTAQLFRNLIPPYVIKPRKGGSSVRTFFARTYPELMSALGHLRAHNDEARIEEYVPGHEVHVVMIRDFRDTPMYISIPTHVAYENTIHTFEDKHHGLHKVSPAHFLTPLEKASIQKAVEYLAQEIKLGVYASFDFKVSPKGVYLLEIDSLPDLAEHSVTRSSLEHAGISFPTFLDHVITFSRAHR